MSIVTWRAVSATTAVSIVVPPPGAAPPAAAAAIATSPSADSPGRDGVSSGREDDDSIDGGGSVRRLESGFSPMHSHAPLAGRSPRRVSVGRASSTGAASSNGPASSETYPAPPPPADRVQGSTADPAAAAPAAGRATRASMQSIRRASVVGGAKALGSPSKNGRRLSAIDPDATVSMIGPVVAGGGGVDADAATLHPSGVPDDVGADAAAGTGVGIPGQVLSPRPQQAALPYLAGGGASRGLDTDAEVSAEAGEARMG